MRKSRKNHSASFVCKKSIQVATVFSAIFPARQTTQSGALNDHINRKK